MTPDQSAFLIWQLLFLGFCGFLAFALFYSLPDILRKDRGFALAFFMAPLWVLFLFLANWMFDPGHIKFLILLVGTAILGGISYYIYREGAPHAPEPVPPPPPPPPPKHVAFLERTDQIRFEHTWIVGGSGHGKTQLLQYLIEHDLRVHDGSIVIIDSQGDLIDTISRLQMFAPGERLHDRLVIIDPHDVEYPVALNLFDVNRSRLLAYTPLERERLTNSLIELYDFVLGSLLDAEMTSKQSTVFRYITRLMLHIPNATIHTLRELLQPTGYERFKHHIDQLDPTAREFFHTEFQAKHFKETKEQVLRRLWGILENRTFERMFSHPRNKLDLTAEMNAGKIILINTAKDLLKEQGTQIFGRFFIAMIAQAAQERAIQQKRTPTFVYIDEFQEYADRNIATILAQARKYNVGLTVAHQYLGQIPSEVILALSSNTSTKMAGGVSVDDAKKLAPMLHGDEYQIQHASKGTFVTFVKNMHPHFYSGTPVEVPFGVLEALPRMTEQQRREVRDIMRERYAVKFEERVTGEHKTKPIHDPDNIPV